jgi:hypothetical protein
MGIPELVQAASRIAGGMIAAENAHMSLSPGRLSEIGPGVCSIGEDHRDGSDREL